MKTPLSFVAIAAALLLLSLDGSSSNVAPMLIEDVHDPVAAPHKLVAWSTNSRRVAFHFEYVDPKFKQAVDVVTVPLFRNKVLTLRKKACADAVPQIHVVSHPSHRRK